MRRLGTHWRARHCLLRYVSYSQSLSARTNSVTVAKTFATFCERFSNVCEFASAKTQGTDSGDAQATTTEDSSSRQTGASSDDDDNNDNDSTSNKAGPVTVTVSPQPTESDSGNDATSARAGFGAILAAVAALAIAL